MTIKELKEMYRNEYADIEVYTRKHSGFHTDNIESAQEYNDDTEVVDYELMDEEDYNNSVLANCGLETDYEDWFGDKNAKILVVAIKHKEK